MNRLKSKELNRKEQETRKFCLPSKLSLPRDGDNCETISCIR